MYLSKNSGLSSTYQSSSGNMTPFRIFIYCSDTQGAKVSTAYNYNYRKTWFIFVLGRKTVLYVYLPRFLGQYDNIKIYIYCCDTQGANVNAADSYNHCISYHIA